MIFRDTLVEERGWLITDTAVCHGTGVRMRGYGIRTRSRIVRRSIPRKRSRCLRAESFLFSSHVAASIPPVSGLILSSRMYAEEKLGSDGVEAEAEGTGTGPARRGGGLAYGRRGCVMVVEPYGQPRTSYYISNIDGSGESSMTLAMLKKTHITTSRKPKAMEGMEANTRGIALPAFTHNSRTHNRASKPRYGGKP